MSDTMNVITHSVARIGSQTSMPATRYRRRLQVRLGLVMDGKRGGLRAGYSDAELKVSSGAAAVGWVGRAAGRSGELPSQGDRQVAATTLPPAFFLALALAGAALTCGFAASRRGAALRREAASLDAAAGFDSVDFDSAGLASAAWACRLRVRGSPSPASSPKRNPAPCPCARLRLFSLSPLKSVSYQPPPLRRNTGADTSFFIVFLPQEGHFFRGIGNLLQLLLIELAVVALVFVERH